MGQEVTEFVVFAPASMGKAVEYARDRILDRLSRSFPGYSFSIEPYGPIERPDEFTVLAVMGIVGDDEQASEPGRVFMADYPPQWVLGAIKEVLREFELAPGLN